MTEQEYKKLTAEITTLNQKIEVLNSKSEMVNSQRKKILSELGLPTDIKETELKELVEKEKAVGLKAVTDGELRRRYWHLDFLASLVGVEEIKAYNEMLEAKKDREEQVRLLEEAINEYES